MSVRLRREAAVDKLFAEIKNSDHILHSLLTIKPINTCILNVFQTTLTLKGEKIYPPPPTTFPYICPTDGPILMSDIPKCSEIYAGPDAADIVAIT